MKSNQIILSSNFFILKVVLNEKNEIAKQKLNTGVSILEAFLSQSFYEYHNKRLDKTELLLEIITKCNALKAKKHIIDYKIIAK